jgi:hypothetical protein
MKPEPYPNPQKLGPTHLYIDFKNIFTKKISIFDSNQSKNFKKMIITLVFEKNANFFAENCRKSQKIVIITSTPGHAGSNKDKAETVSYRGSLISSNEKVFVRGLPLFFFFRQELVFL